MKHKEQSAAVLSQMTTEEKVALQTGRGAWNTRGVKRLGVPEISMSDGPHGLRKEVRGEQGTETVKAVCFPTASKIACGFNRSLAREVGAALGEQCRMENVDILLAPGVNIKRNPRCGRNFEYFSEDPCLAGELAASFVKGVQSQNVGVSLKHFACNSQEYGRFVCDSVVDERCLHEIYLAAFENVVKNARPETVMCAYNKVNGEYCSQNGYLINDVLRGKWGFDGAVITDWGAADDRVKGLNCGLDLQMPEGDVASVAEAVGGSLAESSLDEAALNILDLTYAFEGRTHRNADYEYQHALARKVSAECTVLLKNTCGFLPFMKMDRIAVIGALADKPHFQGGGSSRVNAYRVESLTDALSQSGIAFDYSPAYRLDGSEDEVLLREAAALAERSEKVVLVVGLTDEDESEGFDRKDLKLPDVQRKVIDAVTSANGNVAVVLQCGAPVDTDWIYSAKAVVLDYLGGEAEGGALASVLFGDVNPSGRLAETWPQTEIKTSEDYSSDAKKALYKESIFVGYRYYTTAGVPVAFPFGYGLGYSAFEWKDFSLSSGEAEKNGKVTVTLTVTNTGPRDGADVVQIYVRNVEGRMFKADRELKNFCKVTLKSGQSKTVSIPLSVKSFALYDAEKHEFRVNGGKYEIIAGRNACDAAAVLPLYVKGENDTVDMSAVLPDYYDVGADFNPSDSAFETLLGRPLPNYGRSPGQPHTLNSTLDDIRDRWVGRLIFRRIASSVRGELPKQDCAMPLRTLAMRREVSAAMTDAMIEMLNGRFFGGLIKLLREYGKNKKKIRAEDRAAKKVGKSEKE